MSLAFAMPILASWHDELWDTILDLSALLEPGTWALIGGQAVVAHGFAHEATELRAPGAIEPLGRVITTHDALPTVRLAFRELGFDADKTPAEVPGDIRVAREPDSDSPDRRPQQWSIHPLGTASQDRGEQMPPTVSYQVTKGLRAPWVPVADLLSTIVCEARRFGSDTVEPFAHVRDAAFLVSLLRDPINERNRLSANDRRALTMLDGAVGQRDHHVWSQLPFERDAFTKWRLLIAQ